MLFLLFGLFFVFFLSIIFTRNLFHPAFVISALWFIVIVGFVFLAEKYEMKKLSFETASLFLYWTCGFSFSALIVSKHKYHIFNLINNEPNFNFMRLLYPFVLISNVIFLVLIFILLGNGFSISSFALIRKNFVEDIPPILKIFYLFNTFSVAYYFLCVQYYGKVLSKNKFILLSIILLVLSVMKMTKTVFFMLFFALLIILYNKKKLSLRKIFLMAIVFVLLIIGLAFLRGDKGSIQDFTIMKYIVWYLCSSVAALNVVISESLPLPRATFGGHVFRVFYAILAVIGLHFEETGFYGPWLYVPFPTNVFTVIAPYYVDFDVIGVVIFSIIVGIWYGYIYSFVKRKNAFFTVYYAVLFYTLVMEFFSDYHFYIFTVFVQYFLFLLVCYMPNKKLKYIFSIN